MAEFHNKNAEENGRAPSKIEPRLGLARSFFDILILLDSKWYSPSNDIWDPYPVTKD